MSSHFDGTLRWIRGRVAWVSRTAWFRHWGPRFMPDFERFVRRVTGGRITASGLLVPSLVLHTIGASTGLPRQTELMYVPGSAAPRVFIVTGSNFAREKHPAWTANLLAHPNATVGLRGKMIPVRATLVGDEEREAMWTYIQRQWPGYRQYEQASGRTLRIFRLTEQTPA